MPPLPNNQPMDERPPSPVTPNQSVPQSTGSLVVPTPSAAVSVDGSISDVENLSPNQVVVTTASKPPLTSTPVGPPAPFSRNTPKRQTYHGKDAAKPHQPVPTVTTVS